MNLNSLPAIIKRDVPNAQLPAVYERARQALSECVRLDECKEWGDKAAALASYARQAKNDVLEVHAKRIRLRALERAGQLLLEIKVTRGLYGNRRGASANPNARSKIASRAGLARADQIAAIRMASAPTAVRNSVIDGPKPPSGARNIATSFPTIGLVRGFVASDPYRKVMGPYGAALGTFASLIRKIPTSLARKFTPEEAARIRPYITEISDWVDEFERNLPKVKK